MNWPRKDGEIFIKPTNENNLARMFSSGDIKDDFLKYSRGYKLSADLLIRYVIKTEKISKLDTYFFPIVYLYRQSIELIMKAIFFDKNEDSEKRETFLHDTRHELLLIWDEISSDLEQRYNKNERLLEWVYINIENIADFDKHSDVFRYPNTKDLELFFKEEKRYNLRNIAENMNCLFEFFENFINDNFFNDLNEVISREPLVFVEGGSYYEFSHIGWNYDAEYHYHTYIKGYKECANILVDRALESENKDFNNKIIYPICFLYRNLLELLLKNILINYSSLEIAEIKKALNRKKHSLIGLWNLIKDDINDVPHDEEDKTLKYVEKYIEEFHQKDVRSDKFRYPIDFNIQKYFDSSEEIDVKNLSLCLKELICFFDGVTQALMHRKELRQEIMRDYRPFNGNY